MLKEPGSVYESCIVDWVGYTIDQSEWIGEHAARTLRIRVLRRRITTFPQNQLKVRKKQVTDWKMYRFYRQRRSDKHQSGAREDSKKASLESMTGSFMRREVRKYLRFSVWYFCLKCTSDVLDGTRFCRATCCWLGEKANFFVRRELRDLIRPPKSGKF